MPITTPVDARGARVLLTGSQGFLGKHMRRVLERRGCAVVGVDRPGTGAELEIDLADPAFDPGAAWDRAGQADAVLYLAANIVRTSCVDAAARANLRVIAEAPVRLMEAAVERGQRPHLLYCSTLKTYGPPDAPLIDPARHEQRPDPFSYGSSKVLAERLVAVSSRRAGYAYGTVRSTFIYGPGQHAQNGVPTFLRALWSGQAPLVFGTGMNVRDDVYASDLAEVIAEGGLRRATGVYNCGGERARSLREVALMCCEAVASLGGPSGVRPLVDATKPAKWWLDQAFDIAATRTDLDYEPLAMAEGLRREAAWVRDGSDPRRVPAYCEQVVEREAPTGAARGGAS